MSGAGLMCGEIVAITDDDILGNRLRSNKTLNYANDGIKNGKVN